MIYLSSITQMILLCPRRRMASSRRHWMNHRIYSIIITNNREVYSHHLMEFLCLLCNLTTTISLYRILTELISMTQQPKQHYTWQTDRYKIWNTRKQKRMNFYHPEAKWGTTILEHCLLAWTFLILRFQMFSIHLNQKEHPQRQRIQIVCHLDSK